MPPYENGRVQHRVGADDALNPFLSMGPSSGTTRFLKPTGSIARAGAERLPPKKKRSPADDATQARDLEVSPAFKKKPSRAIVIRGGPPDIPRNVIPVLRKPPIVIVHKQRRVPREPVPTRPESSPGASRRGPPAVVKKFKETVPKPPRANVSSPRAPRAKAPAIRDPVEQRDAPPRVAPHETEPPRRDEEAVLRGSEPAFAPARAKPIPLEGRDPEPAPPVPATRERGLTQTGVLGSVILAVSLVALVLYNATPWVEITGEAPVGPSPFGALEPGVHDARDLVNAQTESAYFARLLNWPLATLLWSALLGAVLLANDGLPKMRVDHHRRIQAATLAILVFLGFAEMLAGARWVGLYVGTLLDEGPSPVHLLVYPYIALVLGAAQTALVAQRFSKKSELMSRSTRQVRVPRWTLVTVAVALLLLAIVPLGTIETEDGRAFTQEGELASSTLDDEGLRAGAENYGVARGLLWLCFYLAIASLLFHGGSRENRPSLRVAFLACYAAILPAVLVAGVLAILAQAAFSRVEDGSTFLAVLFGATCALAALYVVFVRTELLPGLARLRALPE